MAEQDRAQPGCVELEWRGRPLSLEVQWVGSADTSLPVMVFLHEGLGSVAMWKDFPQQFCEQHGLRGLVYSRYGYGNSTPRPADERWLPDFMHRQAFEVLPALLAVLRIERPWLFGHSDGGSIALLNAARFAEHLRGVIVLAPHILVEDISVASIRLARDAYLSGDLRERLARYHADVDSAFRGWNDIWLDPAFRDWTIERDIEAVRCPVLALQGVDDEYGTLEQIHRIARRVPQARLVELEACGHSPHRDQPGRVVRAAVEFAGSR